MKQKRSPKFAPKTANQREVVRILEKFELSYVDLSGALGVSPNTVYRWAAGRIEPPSGAMASLGMFEQNRIIAGAMATATGAS